MNIYQRESPLKVLFVSHAYVTGVNQGKLNAIAATEQAEVGLLVPKAWQAKGWQKFLQLETPYPDLTVYKSKIWFSGRVGAFIYAPWTVLRAIKEFRPDIVHVEQEVFSLSGFELALISRLFNLPIAYFGWENINRRLSLPRQLMRRFVLNTAKLIVAGNKEGENLLRQWGYQKTIAVMPQLGVDSSLFAPKQRHQQNKFVIGYLGRMLYQKGIDILFSAAKHLSQENYSFKIILCGSGLDHEQLKADAKQQDVSHLIEWRDGVSHDCVPEVMNEFDVLVLPSRTVDTWKEQFGHVLIEAMCMNIPVIGSSSGEIPNVIGRDDLVFPEGDSLALAQIIKRAMDKPEWYESVKKYGRDRVEQNFTHERIAQRLIELWQKVLVS